MKNLEIKKEEKTEEPLILKKLPSDIWQVVIGFLELKNLQLLSMASKKFLQLVSGFNQKVTFLFFSPEKNKPEKSAKSLMGVELNLLLNIKQELQRTYPGKELTTIIDSLKQETRANLLEIGKSNASVRWLILLNDELLQKLHTDNEEERSGYFLDLIEKDKPAIEYVRRKQEYFAKYLSEPTIDRLEKILGKKFEWTLERALARHGSYR